MVVCGCGTAIAIKQLEFKSNFAIIRYKKICNCAHMFNFASVAQNVKLENMVKFVFLALNGNTINKYIKIWYGRVHHWFTLAHQIWSDG